MKQSMNIRRLLKIIQSAIILASLIPASLLTANDENGHDVVHNFHPNLLGIFLGGTGENRRDAKFTLGIEYERRINESFGVGGVVERAFGDHDFWVFAVPFAYHSGAWKWYVAPGMENKDNHNNEFLVRVGLEYGFEVGGYELAPQIDVDFVDGDREYVMGIVIARGF